MTTNTIYRKICVVCEGRGYIVKLPDNTEQRCDTCGGNGKEVIDTQPKPE